MYQKQIKIGNISIELYDFEKTQPKLDIVLKKKQPTSISIFFLNNSVDIKPKSWAFLENLSSSDKKKIIFNSTRPINSKRLQKVGFIVLSLEGVFLGNLSELNTQAKSEQNHIAFYIKKAKDEDILQVTKQNYDKNICFLSNRSKFSKFDRLFENELNVNLVQIDTSEEQPISEIVSSCNCLVIDNSEDYFSNLLIYNFLSRGYPLIFVNHANQKVSPNYSIAYSPAYSLSIDFKKEELRRALNTVKFEFSKFKSLISSNFKTECGIRDRELLKNLIKYISINNKPLANFWDGKNNVQLKGFHFEVFEDRKFELIK